jgi:membrane fusion protein, multidrug efflux system
MDMENSMRLRRLIGLVLVCAVLLTAYVTPANWLPQATALWQSKFGSAKTVASTDVTGSGSKKRGGAGTITVLVAKAETGSIPITRQTIGTIVPIAASVLTTSTSGILSEVLMKDGAWVKKGDLIAHLDTKTIDATIVKDKAILLRDQATLQNSLITKRRAKELLAKGLNSQQAGNDADTASQVAAATENYDRAVLAADEVALSLTEIRAPFDGKLGTILLSPGAFVAPGTSVATITQLDPVYAEFSLPDRDAELIHKSFADRTLTVDVAAQFTANSQTVKGPIVFVDTSIDANSGTFKMRAEIPNSKLLLLSGQAINVDVTAGAMENLVLVPNQAVTPMASGNAVYIVKKDNTIEVRPVEIALRGDKIAGINKGVAAGEQVVIEGQINLVNGSTVKIGTAAPAAKLSSETNAASANSAKQTHRPNSKINAEETAQSTAP